MKSHDFLLRARADGEHGDHRGNAENHAQHGEQRAQLVVNEVFKTKNEIGQPLLARDGTGLGDRVSLTITFLNLFPRPNWDLRICFLSSPAEFPDL